MASRCLKFSRFKFQSNICNKSNCKYITTSNFKLSSTVNPNEIKKFEDTSGEWWQGKSYELLRLFNSVRIPLIRDGIMSVSKYNKKVAKPLDGYSILDVGCGGGILSEALARLGAKVTGLDPGARNIEAAMEHASKDPEIKGNLTYVCDTVENLASLDNKFDAVVASEVVEHVANVSAFVNACVELTKQNGSLFFTTLNQTYSSYLLSIVFAEYVLNLVPRGTHEWNKFVKPKDLIEALESLNCRIVSLEGTIYNPVTNKFYVCKSVDNMYSLHAVKL